MPSVLGRKGPGSCFTATGLLSIPIPPVSIYVGKTRVTLSNAPILPLVPVYHQAHFHTGDMDEANKDFKCILDIEPNNRDARIELKKVKESLKAEYRKQSATYGNMFERLAKSGGDMYEEPVKAPVAEAPVGPTH